MAGGILTLVVSLGTCSNAVTYNLCNSGQHCVGLLLEMPRFGVLELGCFLVVFLGGFRVGFFCPCVYFYFVFQQEEASEAEELVMTSLQWVKDPDVNMQQVWERKLVVSNCFFEAIL